MPRSKKTTAKVKKTLPTEVKEALMTLVNEHTRHSDGYVEATALCKKHSKRFKDFHQLKETEAYIEALSLKLQNPCPEGVMTDGETGCQTPCLEGVSEPIKTERVGRTTKTWVHPLLAIRLLQWLNQDYALVVDELFQQYKDDALSLAKDCVEKSDDGDGLDDLLLLVLRKYIDRYHAIFDEIKQRCGGNEVAVYKEVNARLTKAALGDWPANIKAVRGGNGGRDFMTTEEATSLTHILNTCVKAFNLHDPQGADEVKAVIFDVCADFEHCEEKYRKTPQKQEKMLSVPRSLKALKPNKKNNLTP